MVSWIVNRLPTSKRLVSSTNEQEPSIDALYFSRKVADGSISLTIAQTNRLNLRVCKTLANQFGANNVDIYFVIPAKNSFKPTPLEHFGDLAAFGWPKSKKGVTERLMENVVRVTGW